MGDVKPSEYEALGDLIEKIDKDDFSKNISSESQK